MFVYTIQDVVAMYFFGGFIAIGVLWVVFYISYNIFFDVINLFKKIGNKK
jgi:hypothetical protein